MSPKRFLRIELMAQIALIVCTLTTAIIVGVLAFALGEQSHDVYEAFVQTMIGGALGVVPVLIYGAPLYALAETKRRATWPVVISIGSLPGVALIALGALSKETVFLLIGMIAFPSGLIVASCTHLICRKRDASVGAA
jgi:O-antigen/teichoic acid export membrane protein